MARPLHLPEYFDRHNFKSLYARHGQRKHGLRLLALYYVQSGKSVKDVASHLMKTEYTIRQWIRLFGELGLEGLLSIRSGRGRNPKLRRADENLLREEIESGTRALKGGRLRGEDIRELVELKFKASYGLSGIYALLERLGYCWITSRSIHPKGDPLKQDVFKKSVP